MREAEAQLVRIGMGGRCTSLPAISRSGRSADGDRARAVRGPDLLLLDEPAAGLRHKEKQGLADVLRQLRSEGLSILLVEHDMDW
jgi:branched-chain amino acid transport system permease protein